MTPRTNNMRNACLVTLLSLAAVLVGCKKGPGDAKDAAKDAGPPLLITQEDVITLRNNALNSGPSITGSIEPERRADLRAEVPAVVIAVLKENGDPVKRGDLLVRLDQTSIRDSLSSAQSSMTAASQAYEQAERQFQRMKTLRDTGVVSAQQLEDVEIRRNTAMSDREAARSRAVTARQQLQRTEVRAPFDGIVSDRKVSAGDTTQVGKELLKVIDPGSLRFEGLVSADAIGELKVGQAVWFRIHGFGERDFTGTVTRVNPAANITTRQVEVLVSFDDAKQQPNVAGLYAEGRVETRSTNTLALGTATVVREGDSSYAWVVKEGKLHKAPLKLGDRDPRSGAYAIVSGLNEGDQVLRFPNVSLKENQAVTFDAGSKAAVVAEK
ncbi:MAG TPA: efflux RND transporter periplasmic adaptor subunit [Steroidobacteraceae bacterium]|nr:efflux RND transporter periplasmic adaptor subunit [Steroidobacteraceae bacterium]